MSGYNDNAHDTMQGFVSIVEAANIPGYDTSRLTCCIYIAIYELGVKKRDRASIKYGSKYKSLNARWFTKFDKTPTPMTGDIIERDVIFELRELDGSRYGTERSYLFRIFGIYDKYYNKWFS